MATVSSIISSAQDTAESMANAADGMISRAMSAASSYSTISTTYGDVGGSGSGFSPGGGGAQDVALGEKPGTFDGVFSPSVFDEELVLSDLVIPADIVLPPAPDPLDASTLFAYEKPTGLQVDPLAAPELATPSLPANPGVNMPAFVSGSGSSLTAPTITVPSFDAEFTDTAPTAPTDTFKQDYADISPQLRAHVEAAADNFITQYCPQYHLAMAALENRIATTMAGGAILDDAIEQQVYGRGQSRILAERFANEREMDASLAKRGFSIPPGIRQAILKELIAQATRAMSAHASETAIKRAELEINHLQFCLTLSTNIRQAVMQAALQAQANMINTVALAIDFARQASAFAVEVFNARVRLYQANMDLLRIKADVYRTRLEAAFAELRVFEAQVEAEKLKLEVDRNAVEVYQASIQAEEIKIRLYLGQLQGVETVARLELNKLEVFKATIQAQTLQVQIKEIEFRLYQADIEADKAKVEVYSKQLEGYRTQLEGVKTLMDAEKVRSDIVIEGNRSLIQKFEAGIQKARIQLEVDGKKFDSEEAAYRAALELYRVEVQAEAEGARLALQENELTLRRQIATADNRTRLVVADRDILNRVNQVRAQIAMSGAEAYGQMAASAMSGVNGIAQQYAEDSA